MSSRIRTSSRLLMALVILSAVGIVWHVTHNQRLVFAEKKARQFNAMAQALDELDVGLWVWDYETDRVTWSAGLYSVFGVTPEEMPDYETWLTMVHPEDRGRADTICKESMLSGAGYTMSYRIITPSGEVTTILEAGQPAETFMVGACKVDSGGKP